MCGVAVSLVCFSPQMTNVSFAKEQQTYTIGEIIPKNGYIMAEELHNNPNNPYSAIYGYRGIDPNSISIIEQNGKKIFRFYARYFDGKKLKEPFSVEGLANASVIEGWKEGLIGMRIGGVRELAIPSSKAYGEKGQGDKIPANTPLKFVVMAIDKPAEIPEPEIPPILEKYYKEQYGI